jgi:hypothetical protein
MRKLPFSTMGICVMMSPTLMITVPTGNDRRVATLSNASFNACSVNMPKSKSDFPKGDADSYTDRPNVNSHETIMAVPVPPEGPEMPA